jgi:ArsR family transcriptional regulator
MSDFDELYEAEAAVAFEISKFPNFEYAGRVPHSESSPSSPEPGQQEALRRFKADVFQALSHPTRIHIVECLRNGELPVGAILERLSVEPANLSQHLSLLRGQRLVIGRKAGNQVFYSLRDALLIEVLDTMRRYFQAHLEEAMAMLKGIEAERQVL